MPYEQLGWCGMSELPVSTTRLWISSDVEPLDNSGFVIDAVGHMVKDAETGFVHPRSLERYVLVYVLEGGGFFHSDSIDSRQVTAGDMFLLFPEEVHNYGPDSGGRWVEYYILFDGFIPRTYQEQGLIRPEQAFSRTGQSADLLSLMSNAFNWAQARGEGYMERIIAALFRMLMKGYINPSKLNGARDRLIMDVKDALSDCVATQVDLREVLGGTGYSYDYVRRVFREDLGLSPGAYLTRLRVGQAKKLLIETSLGTAEIGYRVGIEDPTYFCRVFKKWVGMQPTVFRRQFSRGR